MTVEPHRDRTMRLDRERRIALQELTALLASLVELTAALSGATLAADFEAAAAARTALLELTDDPALDLAGITEVYNGLRMAIVDHQPGPSWPRPTVAMAPSELPHTGPAAAHLSPMS